MRTVPELVDTLRRLRLVDAAQLESLARQPTGADPRTLAKKLVEQSLLTPFQANQLFTGKGNDLLLGSYVLLELLGEGGMGAVYKARNWKLGPIVALKLIRKERLTNPNAVKRFQREMRASANLDHPNIVRALDADEVRGTHFLVMEYVAGGTDLHKLVREQGPLPLADACRSIIQVAQGLQHAHERGLVHRDIKPHNLILSVVRSPSSAASTPRPPGNGLRTTDYGLVKILDFGLARLGEGDESSTLTQEGTVMGSMDYLAPEQARDSHNADIRADVYSLGCTLYYLLTGKVPFPGGTAAEKMYKHQFEEPTAVEALRPDVPPLLRNIVRKMMAKRPVDRFQAPAAVAADLQAFLEGRPVSAPDPAPARLALPAPSGSNTFAEADNPFAGLNQTNTAVEAPIKVRVPLPAPAAPSDGRRRKLALTAGSALLVLGVIIALGVAFTGGTTPKKQDEPEFKLPKPPPGPTQRELAEAAEKERKAKEAAEQKRLDDEVAKEKKRADVAELDLKPLAATAADPKTTFASFAKDVAAFKGKYGGTPAAIRAAEMLMKLKSPLDELDPAKIPEDAKAAWRAAGHEPPVELVGVLGQGRASHQGGILVFVVSPDSKLLATAGYDGTVRLTDMATLHEVRKFPGHKSAVWSLKFSPDGKQLASGGGEEDKTIRLWEIATGKEIRCFEGSTSWVSSLAFSPDGKQLVSGHGHIGSPENTIRWWHIESGMWWTPFFGQKTCVPSLLPGGSS